MKPSVGILAVDTYLPEKVRTNDEWPSHVVESWTQRMSNIVPRSEASVDTVTDGVRRALDAITALGDDPFQGVRTVRVIAEEDGSSDLEARAAKLALERAGVRPDEIDLLLSHPMVPDLMCVNPASAVHEKVGLRREAPAFGLEGVCTSFILQLDLARKAVLADDAKRILVTQSSACTRVMPDDAPFSPWFGDAGGAAVLGESEPGYGLLSTSFRTWGSLSRAFCATVPGGRWHDGGGRVVACNEDRAAARRMQLEAPDIGKEIIADVLQKAGVRHDEVSYFACHQPAAWFPEVCRAHSGLVNAKVMPTFSWTGNLSSVNIPMQLAVASKEGLLKRGDVVVLFALASGMMAAGAVMRWM